MATESTCSVEKVGSSQTGENVPPSDEDLEIWKGALLEAKIDFVALFRPSDLEHLNGVLTQQEISEIKAQNLLDDQLSREVFKRVLEKPHDLLRKIPACLREARDDSPLACELEVAYDKQVKKLKGPSETSSVSIAVQVQQEGAEGTLAYATPEGVKERKAQPAKGMSHVNPTPEDQQSPECERKERLQRAETNIATLEGAHNECLHELRAHIVANEGFMAHPEKFLEQLIKEDLPGVNAMEVLEQAFPNVTKAENVSVALDQIQYSNFNHCLNPELLVRFAEIIEATKEAEGQVSRVSKYCNIVTVDDFINMREHNPFSATPSEALAKIAIKLEEKWSCCTMQQVREGISHFCNIAGIPKFLFRLQQIERGCIAISILVPGALITNDLKMKVQGAQSELEKHYFVEVKAGNEVLFCMEDKKIQRFVREKTEDLPKAYCATKEGDDTWKMYQLMRVCQNHYESMLEFSYTLPEHFWRYFAVQCLRRMGGTIDEPSSSDREGRIESCLKNCQLNVSDNCLDRHVDAGRDDKIALIYKPVGSGGTERVTYKELLVRTCRTANVLKKHGVRRGDTVVIFMPLCPQVVVSMLACARIGARHCNVPSSSSTYILKQRLLDARAVALMTVDSVNESSRRHKMFDTVVQVLTEQKFSSLKEVFISTGSDQCAVTNRSDLNTNMHHIETEVADYSISDNLDPEKMYGDDTLFVMYTSGTTGGPKGLEHTQAGYLLYAMVTYQVVFDIEPGNVTAFIADPGWIVSHTYTVYGPLASGSTAFLYEGPLEIEDVGELWKLVKENGITQLTVTASKLASLMNKSCNKGLSPKPDSLKFLGSVGECLPRDVRRWYRESLKCPILDHYWQTETGGVLLANRVIRNEQQKVDVKESLVPFFGVQPILVNPKNMREDSRCDCSGNLYLGLPLPGLAKTISGNHDLYRKLYLEKGSDHHGFFYTHDGAYRKSDNSYSITGRVDDMITTGELRFDPNELELTMREVYIVKQVAVVARPFAGRETGPIFFVVLKEYTDYTYTRMQNYLKERLIKVHPELEAKHPLFVLVKELPTTHTSKKSRHYLREIAAGRGIHKRTDMESLENPDTPLDINILYSLCQEDSTCEEVLAYESADYQRVRWTSLKYREVFWSSLAKKLLVWRCEDFVAIDCCSPKTGHIEWFKEGKLNASESCLDRWANIKGKDLLALLHYKPDKKLVKLSYKSLKEMTCQIASLMTEAGLKCKASTSQESLLESTDKSEEPAQAGFKPKVVMICMPLTPLAIASMLACARIGAIHYTVPFDLESEKLWEKCDAVRPSAIVTVYGHEGKVKDMLQGCPNQNTVTVFFAQVPEKIILPSDSEYKMVDLEKEMKSHDKDVAITPLPSNFPLLATCSTVAPHAVVYHSHAGFLLHSAASYKYVLGYQSYDRSAVTNDLSSMMSLVYSVYGPLCNGGTAVLFDERFREANQGWCWEMASRAKLTQLLVTPDFVEEMKQSNPFNKTLSSLRVVGTSGKELSKDDWNWLKVKVGRNKVTIIDHYGISEIGGCIIAPRPYFKQTHTEQAPGSPMVPFFGIDLGIFGPNNEEITEPGVEGDLWIKSTIPGMGTHLHGDVDGEVMLSNYFNADTGYYKTGDRATKDKDGNYHVKRN